MSADRETLDVYDKEAAAYEMRVAEKSTPGLTKFLNLLPKNAHVLDLGCGPGLSSVEMMKAGHSVDAVDGSIGMVDRARANGVEARQALFDDIKGTDLYDGVWANFSLLHLPRAEFLSVLRHLYRALRTGGLLHIGMKVGTGEDRDSLGRLYSYYQPDELADILEHQGFTVLSQTLGAGRGLDGSISDWIVILAHG